MTNDFVEMRLESNDFSCHRLQIHRLTGREAISELFSFDVSVVSLDPEEPSSDAMTGAEATLVFERDHKEVRQIHGMIVEVVEMLETEVKTRAYRLRFVPRAFRLTLVQTQDIYMDLTVPEILARKLDQVSLGAEDVEFRLMATYPSREFVVQYKETDLAFISRLAEHVGISFFFEHESGRDKIVFTDHKDGFRPASWRSAVHYRPRGEQRDVHALEARTQIIPSTYVVQDYNYRTPHIDLTSSADSLLGFAGGVVEHGSHFKTQEEGKALARIRAEEREATRRVYSGKSDACQLSGGARITLENGPRLDREGLLLLSVDHEAEQSVAVHGGSGAQHYVNSFRAIDAELTYRPARVTPIPRIFGVLTGVVEQDPEAPVSDYAMIDSHGRYTIKFLFDTTNAREQQKASRPVRMIQAHAGPNYGVHFPLKPGVEVLLVFVDGDPDRPLIVGAVPNPETPSPVTQSNPLMNRIKTASGVLIELKDR
jgi:type VI secretion system secreted protein VgrG